MTHGPADDTTHLFDGWEIRPAERVLLVRGVPAKLGSRAFDLLLALVQRQGRVATKAELFEAAWPGLVVEENNLSVQIAALRKLLGGGAIVNVSGHGYRLAAAPLTEREPAPASGAAAGRPEPRRGRLDFAAIELVGRQAELGTLLPLLQQVRLVSVVGTGGVGKTALAKALLHRISATWRDGVHWIDLAPLQRGTPLLPLVAKTLGVLSDQAGQSDEDLFDLLAQMHCLIALDNCEHLLDEVAAALTPLLARAAGMHWLATSREPLGLSGETVFRLRPLHVPEAGGSGDPEARGGALELFRERVQMGDPAFVWNELQLASAAELCRQLDGLPLAIEMAAAQVATLGLHGVASQIDQRLRLRAGGRDATARHHTLLNTFEWSYGLLSGDEQRLFCRLEPFLGGFDAAMVQELCANAGSPEKVEPWQALQALSGLVSKSLVQFAGEDTAGGPTRYRLFESARDYARLQLREAAAEESARRGHAVVVAQRFAGARDELEQVRDRVWAARYLPERRNVGAALTWACTAREPELLARLVAALAQLDAFAQIQSDVVSYAVPEEVLAEAPTGIRARAWLELGQAYGQEGSRERATDLVLRAWAEFESIADVAGTYEALMRLIQLYLGRPGLRQKALEMWSRLQRIDEAQVPLRTRLNYNTSVAFMVGGGRTVERLEQLQLIAQAAGFDATAAVCRVNIIDELLVQRRFDDVVTSARAMLAADRSQTRMCALINHNLALALVRLGRTDEARDAARAVLRAWPNAVNLVIDSFAFAAATAGRWPEAALIAGRSARINRERDRNYEPAEAALVADTLAALHAGLGEAACAELMRAGEQMSTADVLAIALPA